VGAAVEAAIKTLENLGARISEVTLEGADQTLENLATIIYSDACAVHADRLEGQDEKWGAQTIERMRIALDRTSRDYARALRAKEAWQRMLARTFRDHDVILTPTLPHPPPPIEDNRSLYEATLRVGANTYAGALGAIPGLSIPCGVTTGGLSIGMQLEAAWWQEPALLRVGQAFQEATDWHLRRPALPGKR
jgi:aspartyl-tRNA(Asn)/glutamyl-tRNA(Gln) amidotransferase subunit A